MSVKSKNNIIDKEDAFLRAGNDLETLSLMAEVYFDFSKKQLLLIEDAIQNFDAIEINRIAHTLRGSLSMLGSIEACQSTILLEESTKKNGLDNIETLYSNMCKDITRFDEALRNILNNTEEV